MRILIIFLLLTFFSCKKIVSKEQETNIEQIENQNSSEKIALDFINQYVEYCNDRNSEQSLIEWIYEQQNVTDNFKIELKKTIIEAENKEPELGLGIDPIFDAQDYPDNGFELEKSNSKSEFVIVNGKDWKNFKLKINMEWKNEQWFVNRILNISE